RRVEHDELEQPHHTGGSDRDSDNVHRQQLPNVYLHGNNWSVLHVPERTNLHSDSNYNTQQSVHLHCHLLSSPTPPLKSDAQPVKGFECRSSGQTHTISPANVLER